MTIKIIHINGFYVPDDDNTSKVLFAHLYSPSEENNYNDLRDLTDFKILAKSHGWKIKVRKARKSDMEDDF